MNIFYNLCCAMVCDFYDMLCDSNAMLWDMFAILWGIEMKDLMIWLSMLCYGMLWDWTESPPCTEEFHTFESKMIKKPKFTTNPHCEDLFFETKTFKTELKLCCIICFGLIWYDEWNYMRLYSMVLDFDAMLWYVNAMLWDSIAMLHQCHGVCCKRYAWADCSNIYQAEERNYENHHCLANTKA